MLLLLLVLVVDYANRTLIGALGPTLQRVFHIGNTELGLLAAAFSAVGAVATIPLGMLGDRLKRTWLLALSLLIWAAAMGATRAAVSFAMLFGTRLLLGAVGSACAANAHARLPLVWYLHHRAVCSREPIHPSVLPRVRGADSRRGGDDAGGRQTQGVHGTSSERGGSRRTAGALDRQHRS
jgi:Major Facilitator Superfamily